MSSEPLLFSPMQIRDLILKNRIVVAPMHQYSAEAGFVTDWHLVNAGRFATGGAGLVFMESTKIERRGCGTLGDVGIWDDKFIPGLSRVAAFLKINGAAAGLQLGHTGRKGKTKRPWEGDGPLTEIPDVADWDAWDIVAPSAIPFADGWTMPRALRRDEIPEVVNAWGRAAARAHTCGFDALEIHGAHGYLIHSFLSPESNQRNDDYGGSLTNRVRFALEVTECVRENWPKSKPLFMRLSIEDDAGWGPSENVLLAIELKKLGVDIIDCSSGGTTSKAPISGRLTQFGYQVPYAEQIRREAKIMTMAVGLIIHGDQAEDILQKGQADLVAIGREFLNNPNWAMDAAQKLGVDPGYAGVPEQSGFWLAKRASRGFGCNPSTYQRGLTEKRT